MVGFVGRRCVSWSVVGRQFIIVALVHRRGGWSLVVASRAWRRVAWRGGVASRRVAGVTSRRAWLASRASRRVASRMASRLARRARCASRAQLVVSKSLVAHHRGEVKHSWWCWLVGGVHRSSIVVGGDVGLSLVA
ncbi:hypothetical protein ACXZ9C_10595 [Streptococcus agalactiae]